MAEFAIPVVFDVVAPDRETAARILADALSPGNLTVVGFHRDDVEVEDWFFPESQDKHVDGNDRPASILTDEPFENAILARRAAWQRAEYARRAQSNNRRNDV